MDLLELAEKISLMPKRTSSTHGGEYHSVCPSCQTGEDRFIIWPHVDRYWCKQCKVNGDSIQFCRTFFGMPFQEACAYVGKNQLEFRQHVATVSKFKANLAPSITWEEKATKFIAGCHERLLVDIPALNLVMQRGLLLDTIRKFQIGWNPVCFFDIRKNWGLDGNSEGREKKLYLPKGIVIPSFKDAQPIKIKIRKAAWKVGGPFAKYHQVPGGSNSIAIYGDLASNVVVLVKAELDAMLVVQEAGEFCGCGALGGAQKRPDEATHAWLRSKKLILYALDFDESGKKEFKFWKELYRNLKAWPVPKEKSPGDAFKVGCNLNKWVADGITICSSILYGI